MWNVLSFFAVTFGFSWGVALALWWLDPSPLGRVLFGVVFMFGPALGAAVATRGRWSTLGIGSRPNRWWLLAWLAPLAIALATAGVAAAVPGISWSWDPTVVLDRLELPPEQLAAARTQLRSVPAPVFFLATVLQVLLAGPTVNALAAFGEELGWRGFLYRVWGGLGFWRASLLVGLVWGVWHAPLILMGHNYPEHPVIGVGMMVVFCVLLAPLMQLVRERGGSVLAASILHGSINASAGLPLLLASGGSELIVGLTGLSGFLVLAAVNLALSVRRPRS